MVNHPKFFGWESFGMVRFDLWIPSSWLNEDIAFIVFLYIFLTYFLHLNNYLVTLFHNTICRAQLFCPFLLSASEYLSNMLFSYHLLYFCTALSLIIMLSSHYHHHKSKTYIQSADTVPVHGHSPLVEKEVFTFLHKLRLEQGRVPKGRVPKFLASRFPQVWL